MDFRGAYALAAHHFAELIDRLPPDGWEDRALGHWTRRDLVGHTVSSALRQIQPVLESKAVTRSVLSAEGYWAFARVAPPELYAAAVEASTDDARRTGRWLGGAPTAGVRECLATAMAALERANDDDLVMTAAGGMTVADWLPTRTFELAVHTMDVADSARLDAGVPPEVLAESAALAARVAVAVGDGPLILRVLTGRAQLPPHFSIL